MKTNNANNTNTAIDVDFFLQEIANEKTINLDFSYLTGVIESWWKKNSYQDTHILKIQLVNLFLAYLRTEDTFYFDKVGLASECAAAVCIKNIFSLDSPRLALAVHEALADLFHLTDIKYDYEEHKALHLKPSAEKHREWGNGHSDITPHWPANTGPTTPMYPATGWVSLAHLCLSIYSRITTY